MAVPILPSSEKINRCFLGRAWLFVRARETVGSDHHLHPFRRVLESPMVVDGKLFSFGEAGDFTVGVDAGFDRFVVVDDFLTFAAGHMLDEEQGRKGMGSALENKLGFAQVYGRRLHDLT